MHINTINYSTGTRMNIRAVFLVYTENSIRARCPSTFSSIAIELNLKMTDRYTCNTDIQPTVYGSYLSLLRFSSIAIELKVDGQRALRLQKRYTWHVEY